MKYFFRYRVFGFIVVATIAAGCSETPEPVSDVSEVSATPEVLVDQAAVAPEPSDKESPEPSAKETVVSADQEDEKQPSVVGEYNELGELATHVILNKGTERRSLDGYTMTMDPGTYICRQCNAQLYRSDHKFESHCGWPSFDDEIEGAVDRHPDADGRRVEIVCANCQGHLGHIFEGEGYTKKNIRHCVNSISMVFVPEGKELPARIVADDAAKGNDSQ